MSKGNQIRYTTRQTILVTQEVAKDSRVRRLRPPRKVRGIVIGCVIRLGVPIVGKRQDEEKAMLLSEPNNRVELLKAVRTIINGNGSVTVDELEPSADFRNRSNV